MGVLGVRSRLSGCPWSRGCPWSLESFGVGVLGVDEYTDPDGEFIQVLIGAAAGAIGEVASQAIEGKGFNGEKIAASALMGGITGGASAVASAGLGKLATIAVDAAMNAVGNAGESLVHDSIDGKAGDLGKALTSAAASVPGLGNSGTMQKIVGDSVQSKLTSQGMNQTAAQAIGASAGAATASTVKAAEKMVTEKDQQIEKK